MLPPPKKLVSSILFDKPKPFSRSKSSSEACSSVKDSTIFNGIPGNAPSISFIFSLPSKEVFFSLKEKSLRKENGCSPEEVSVLEGEIIASV